MMDEKTITVSLHGYLNLEEIECDFMIESETYVAEPYSWGESRGMETAITGANLVTMYLGDNGYTIGRDIAVCIFGEEAIKGIEDYAMNRAAND